MIRKTFIGILLILIAVFTYTIIKRVNMPYNEQGIYFDGTNTYSENAVVAYTTVTLLLLTPTIVLLFLKQKSK